MYLLVSCLKEIIDTDFAKISKLIKYLNNVATLFSKLEIPIS